MNSIADWDALIGENDRPGIDECLAAGARGVYITNEHYHSLPGISGSNLALLAESNRHLDNKHLFNLGDTEALRFGTLVHTLVLEPESVIDRYAVAPAFNGRTRLGKEEKLSFHALHGHKTIIPNSDYKKASRMAENIQAIAGDIIDCSIKERSLFVDVNGLVLKCRLDCDVDHLGDDYDIKSITLGAKEFSDATLESHIKRFKYHWSAAFRNIIRQALGKPVRDSYLIFCDTGPGHRVRLIKISREWINDSLDVVGTLLENRISYLATRQDVPVTEIDDRFRDKY